MSLFKKKKEWLITIEIPTEANGHTYFTVYEGGKEIAVSSYKMLRKLVKKYNAELYATNDTTKRLLTIAVIPFSTVEKVYLP